MSPQEESGITDQNLRFDLTTPCSDCPFRYDVPKHEGIASDLSELFMGVERGVAAHSCHKTDPRSDCDSAQRFAGPVQHCAGFMIMLHKEGVPSNAMLAAVRKGLLDLKQLNMAAPVYRRIGMLRAYLTWTREVLAERAE